MRQPASIFLAVLMEMSLLAVVTDLTFRGPRVGMAQEVPSIKMAILTSIAGVGLIGSGALVGTKNRIR